MYLGFYTTLSGLGKTPTDVKLNNIAIPAYLPAGALGGNGDNATCNFWRSAENISAVINTGNEQGKAGFDGNLARPESIKLGSSSSSTASKSIFRIDRLHMTGTMDGQVVDT